MPFQHTIKQYVSTKTNPTGVQRMGSHKSTVNLRKKTKRRLKNERTKARAAEQRKTTAGN